MSKRTWGLVLVVLGIATSAAAETSSTDKRETFGAVIGPAVLPSGGVAAYGLLGAPDLAVGLREGFGAWELEARAKLDYLQVALSAELLAKIAMMHSGGLDVAPFLGVGFMADSGSTYYNSHNFSYVGPRVLLGGIATQRLTDLLRAAFELKLPADFALGSGGGGQFRPSFAAGLELYLGQDVTGLLMGQLGLDSIKEPGGQAASSLGWGIRLGIGFRLF